MLNTTDGSTRREIKRQEEWEVCFQYDCQVNDRRSCGMTSPPSRFCSSDQRSDPEPWSRPRSLVRHVLIRRVTSQNRDGDCVLQFRDHPALASSVSILGAAALSRFQGHLSLQMERKWTREWIRPSRPAFLMLVPPIRISATCLSSPVGAPHQQMFALAEGGRLEAPRRLMFLLCHALHIFSLPSVIIL